MERAEIAVLKDICKEIHEIRRTLDRISQAPSASRKIKTRNNFGTYEFSREHIDEVIIGMTDEQRSIMYYLVGLARDTASNKSNSQE